MNNLIALLPVRSGSQRVKNKNFKPFFQGKSLFELKLEQLMRHFKRDNIMVSSDNKDALDYAFEKGVRVHKRAEKYANDVSGSVFASHMAEVCIDFDYLMYAPCTSPLLTDVTLNNILHNWGGENIITTSLVKEFLWMDGKPMNYELGNMPQSQDLPLIHKINFAICISKVSEVLNYGNFVSLNPTFITLNGIESIDIDETHEFIIAQQLYESINNREG